MPLVAFIFLGDVAGFFGTIFYFYRAAPGLEFLLHQATFHNLSSKLSAEY